MNVKRREFLSSVVTAAAGAAGAVLLVACGGETGTPDAPPGRDATTTASCTANGTNTAISGNHGHTMSVSKADVTAGASKTYDISGSAGHAHNVTISAALFTMLMNNTTVTTTSTSGDHTHTITVSCA